MPFQITITADAERQLQSLTARDQRKVEDAILARLIHVPTKVTHSIKQLRPNPFAQFELRVGDFRVLYNVEENFVVLLVVGRKVGEKLVVEGEEFHAHRDNPPEQPGSEPSSDAE